MPGGTILVYDEQGLGEAIMAVRYAPLVKERVGTVLLECPASLQGLLAGCPGIDGVVDPTGPAPAADVQSPLMSLMRTFGTRPDTIPARVPYIFTDATLRERWRKELGNHSSLALPEINGASPHIGGGAPRPSPLYSGERGWGEGAGVCKDSPPHPQPLSPEYRGEGSDLRPAPATEYRGEGSGLRPALKVGIVWQGNPKHPGDRFRLVKLTQFAPLAAVPGVKLYSLQKGTAAEQLAALAVIAEALALNKFNHENTKLRKHERTRIESRRCHARRCRAWAFFRVSVHSCFRDSVFPWAPRQPRCGASLRKKRKNRRLGLHLRRASEGESPCRGQRPRSCDSRRRYQTVQSVRHAQDRAHRYETVQSVTCTEHVSTMFLPPRAWEIILTR